MKITSGKLLLAAVVAVVGLFLLQLLGPNPAIVVSPQTTVITAPLADDGLPDYATYLLHADRKGVTPESNAAIPFLQAMWPAGLDPKEQQVVCDELGMERPEEEGLKDPSDISVSKEGELGDIARSVAVRLLAKKGIVPPEGQDVISMAGYRAWQKQLEAKRQEKPAVDKVLNEFSDSSMMDGMGMGLGDPQTAYEATAESLLWQCQEHPWTSDQFPELAAWIIGNDEKYALLHEAAKRPDYYFPSPSLLTNPSGNLLETLLPDIQTTRSAMRILSYRAMLYLGEEKFALAWADCRAMHQLAEHIPDLGLVNELIAIACHGVADNTAREILTSSKLPASVAKEIDESYRSRTLRRSMAKAMDGERLMMVTSILAVAGDRNSIGEYSLEGDLGPLTAMSSASIDWNYVLEKNNVWYDRLSAAMALKSYAKKQQALGQIEYDISQIEATPGNIVGGILSRKARSNLVADVFSALFLPAVSSASQAEDRRNSELGLMQTATALARYRAERGEYPPSLDELVPKLLPKFPTDIFTGAKLSYTKTENGYLLVDHGPNGTNEGGMNALRSRYKGYLVGDLEQEQAARKLLGEPLDEPAAEDLEESPKQIPEAWNEFSGGEFLEELIPVDSDDNAIRMPALPADWSALE